MFLLLLLSCSLWSLSYEFMDFLTKKYILIWVYYYYYRYPPSETARTSYVNLGILLKYVGSKLKLAHNTLLDMHWAFLECQYRQVYQN